MAKQVQQTNNIQYYFDYWECFIQQWSRNCNIYGGWTDPDRNPPLVNSQKQNNSSSNYIPEPWWGWHPCLKKELHSVVINFNPGQGKTLQTKSNVLKINNGATISYAKDIVWANPHYLPDTVKWHWNKRAEPILDALNQFGFIGQPYDLQNHLSIELIPWHTKGVNKNYWKYISANALPIFDYCLSFAAEASKNIQNSKLKNKVIVRMGECYTLNLLRIFKEKGFHYISPYPQPNNGKYSRFTIDAINGVEFICIWDKLGNDFPKPLANIIKLI